MIYLLKKRLNEIEKDELSKKWKEQGISIYFVDTERTILIFEGNISPSDLIDPLLIEKSIEINTPYQLANRKFKPEGTIIQVGSLEIGGSNLTIIAGPCAVESKERLFKTAEIVKQMGAHILRGGAYKPRTSPYSFQGLEEEGLKILAQAREKFDIPIVTEATSPENADIVAQYADIIQIGTRNMQNFELLKKVGKLGKPVLLKRGMSATIEDWLNAAEYILSFGNFNVILCERGIRTIERLTRNTLDLTAIPLIKDLSHLPVIVDPSHGTGLREKVIPMARAAVACGADGITVEVHHDPDKALSDGPQSLYPDQFRKLMNDLEIISVLTGKEIVTHRVIRDQIFIASQNQISSSPKIAFLGKIGSFSSQVARKIFPDSSEFINCSSFRQIFEEVVSRNAGYGVLPIENTITGSIHGNYELFLDYPEVFIVGERIIRVSQHLAVFPGTTRENIQVLFAHPQGFAQSSRFLESMRNIRIMDVGNTEEAARRIAEFGLGGAGITSQEAVEKYHLTVLEEDIEDNIRNFTRFIILSKTFHPSIEDDKVSGIFILKNQPGALFQILKIFADAQINIVKLESRPIPGKPWEYLFYADWEGNIVEDRFKKIIQSLEEHTLFLRILGSYKNIWKK